MATAPSFFADVVERLAHACLMTEANDHWRRVIIEKPFGHDLDSAKVLNRQLLKVAWNNRSIASIITWAKRRCRTFWLSVSRMEFLSPSGIAATLTMCRFRSAETVGVEKRGSYYDTAGALRDMVPNHIMQLITLTAMEPPISFEANAVRDEQAKILHAAAALQQRGCAQQDCARAIRGWRDGQRARARLSL